jgi:hypothetical protein
MTGSVDRFAPDPMRRGKMGAGVCADGLAGQCHDEARSPMDAELLKDAPPEVLRAYWMRKREFEEELRSVALTSEDNLDDVWLEKWSAYTHPAVIVRTMITLSEFENGLLKLTTTRKNDPNFKSWARQLSRVRAANKRCKEIAGYFEPAPEGLGLTRRRSAKQNFSILAELIARNERALVKLVQGIEAWRAACVADDIEFGDDDLDLLALLDVNVSAEGDDPVSIREVVERIKTGVRRL